MASLMEMAIQVEKSGVKDSVADFLKRLDQRFILRKHGKPRLRKVIYDEDGVPLKTCHVPHIQIDEQLCARFWKCVDSARDWFKSSEGREIDNAQAVEIIVLTFEHVIREMRIDGDDAKVCRALMFPLPKEKWVRRRKFEHTIAEEIGGRS